MQVIPNSGILSDGDLTALIAKARAYVDSLTPEQYREMVHQQGLSWVRAEMAMGDEGTRTK